MDRFSPLGDPERTFPALKVGPRKPSNGKPEVVGDGSVKILIYHDKNAIRSGYRVVYWHGRQRVRKFYGEYARAKEEARRIAGNLRAGKVQVANTDVSDLEDLNRARRAISGLGVPKNDQKAYEWYQKAVQLSSDQMRKFAGRAPPALRVVHAVACGNVGTCLYRGEGVAKDDRAALGYLAKAAVEFGPARNLLAEMAGRGNQEASLALE